MIPEFSLLICVCANDDEDHFRLALTSVTRDQSLAPTEVVVVIDGPVSQEIHRTVTAVEDSEIVPFKVLEVKKQSGLAFCLNLGLKNCKYKWVARMDADDIALPNRFLMQMGYLKGNPNLAVLGSSVIEFGNVKNERVKTVVTDTEELKRVLKVRNPINHPSCILNKDKVLSVGGYPDLAKNQDWGLWVLLAGNGYNLANLNEVLLRFRITDNFYTKRGVRLLKYDFAVLRMMRRQNQIGPWFLLILMVVRIIFRSLPKNFLMLVYGLSRK